MNNYIKNEDYYLIKFKKEIKKEIRKALKPIKDYIKNNNYGTNR